MRIQEVRVHRYGPLSDVPLTDLGNFTLVFGENESGKTLLLDAILRFLLKGKRARDLFSRLDRVEHEPDGFIELQKGDKTFRFPDDGSLPDLLDIHAEDLRNILVVRASDLQVQGGKEKPYYAELTDRLTGIHREPIRKTHDKLQQIGRLTPGGSLSDAQDNDKISSRVEKAKKQISRIFEMKERSAETDLVALEGNLLGTIDRREDVTEELGLLSKAKKREDYKAGQSLLSDLEECLAAINALPAIEQKHYDDWRAAEKNIEESSQAMQQSEGELSNLKSRLESVEAELDASQGRLEELRRKQSAVENLRDQARRYGEKLQAVASRSPLIEAAPRALIFLGILFALALVGSFLRPQSEILPPVYWIIGGALVVVALAWVVERIQEGRRRSKWEVLRLEAAQHGMEVEGIESLLEAVESFFGDLERAQNILSQGRTQKGVAEERVENQRKRIEENRKNGEEAKEKVANLKESLGLRSFRDFESKRTELRDLQERRQDLIAKLGTRYGYDDGPVEETLEVWRTNVEELGEYAGVAEGVEYDEAREAGLKEELEGLNNVITEVDEKLKGILSEIAESAGEANRILWRDEQLPGDTLEDLAVIEKELRDFVDEVEHRAFLASKAIEILDEIREEEEQKVKDLFSEDDQASNYFRDITNGAYEAITYEPSDGELKVMQPGGNMIRAYALSSGTYDQLYLATRLSLADRILQGEPGFLLLDDPFLTSDTKRLLRQLEILTNLAAEGWQVIYLSVKDEIHNGLKKLIKNGRVGLIELPSIHL